MALCFTPEDMILNFRPRSHVRFSSREYVLWPTWAYRVVAPRAKERTLNMFQRAILGLCRVGLSESDILGSKLSIHPELADFIKYELFSLGYLSAHGVPSQKGISALEGDSYEIDEMVTGYVFQDPWSGDLWPRFIERLDYCDRAFEENGFPVLLLGTTGKPRRQSAFMVLPDKRLSPSRPSAASVIEAVRVHHRINNSREEGKFFEEEDDLEPDSNVGTKIHRVSFIEEQPIPVFLTTFLYLPDSAESGSSWYAADPFGVGHSLRLRKKVEQVMQEQQALYGVVNRLVGRGLHDGIEGLKRLNEQFKIAAELTIDQRLTVNMRSHPAFDCLVNMEILNCEGKWLGSDFSSDKIRQLLRSGVKVLEVMFGELAQRHLLMDVWKQVYVKRIGNPPIPEKDVRIYSEIYRSAIRYVGFCDPIPEALLSVKPGQIKSVAVYGDQWRLRPLVCATVLAAKVDPDHPLHILSKFYPNFLLDIDSVATLGGAAGHAQDQDQTPTYDEAVNIVEIVYSLVQAMTGLVTVNDLADTCIGGID